MARAQGGNRSSCGQAWGFGRGSVKAQEPSLTWGVPMPCLDPHRTPASHNNRTSASMGLGPLGLGCQELA